MVNNTYKLTIGLSLWVVLLTFIFSIPFMALTVNKEIQAPFLDPQGSPTAIVFFGFRGCRNVCPMTLSKLRQLYDSQKIPADLPQVIFVDIDSQSNPAEASNYAKQFHADFTGMHVSNEELIKYSGKFGLNIKQQGKQISHLGKTYLLRRKENNWNLVKIF